MSDYIKHQTTYEVWKTIREAHPNLKVFSSYSAPDGDRFGDPNKAVMITSYGFEDDTFPIIEARTEWDVDFENLYSVARKNETHKYWLCVGAYT